MNVVQGYATEVVRTSVWGYQGAFKTYRRTSGMTEAEAKESLIWKNIVRSKELMLYSVEYRDTSLRDFFIERTGVQPEADKNFFKFYTDTCDVPENMMWDTASPHEEIILYPETEDHIKRGQDLYIALIKSSSKAAIRKHLQAKGKGSYARTAIKNTARAQKAFFDKLTDVETFDLFEELLDHGHLHVLNSMVYDDCREYFTLPESLSETLGLWASRPENAVRLDEYEAKFFDEGDLESDAPKNGDISPQSEVEETLTPFSYTVADK